MIESCVNIVPSNVYTSMGVGVWAATSASLTVTTKVAFTATAGVNATVQLKVAGGSDATYKVKSAKVTADVTDGATKDVYTGDTLTTEGTQFANTYATLWSKDTNNSGSEIQYNSGSVVTADLAVTLEDKGQGYIKATNTVVYTFDITNNSTTKVLYVTVTVPTEGVAGEWSKPTVKAGNNTSSLTDYDSYGTIAAKSGNTTSHYYVEVTCTAAKDLGSFSNKALFDSISFAFTTITPA